LVIAREYYNDFSFPVINQKAWPAPKNVVRHLVELHGGTVKADSTGAGRGSTFIISLPLATAWMICVSRAD
jgi:hypothetical protein